MSLNSLRSKLSSRGVWSSAGIFLVFQMLVLSLGGAVEKPNILFAISDDQSFPHAGAYGCEWVKTPAFDRVADQGLLFMNAYTPNAKCSPSRAIILTGRNSWQLEEAANHVFFFQEKFLTYCEVLSGQTDYVVGTTGKGLSPVLQRADRQPTGRQWDEAKLESPIPKVSRLDYAANFEAFLNAKPDGQPFCFWYGGLEPHRSYEYGIGMTRGGKKLDDLKRVPKYWPDNETIRTDMLDYAYEVEHFDAHLGRMLKLLEERGELENTVVIVTSDNGMPFPRAKGAQYELSNHMPLAIMWPSGIQNPGRTITDYVSFIDIAPTLLELAGVVDPEAAGMQPIQGESLRPIFTSKKSGQVMKERNRVLLGQERHDIGRPDDVGYPIRSIIREGMFYIHNFEPDRWPMGNPETGYPNSDASPTKTEVLKLRRAGGDPSFWEFCFGKRQTAELYDLSKDPDCLRNLINDPDFVSQVAALKQELFDALKSQNDPRMFGKGAVFDNYIYGRSEQSDPPNRHIRNRDYYNRYTRGEIDYKPTWVSPSDFEEGPLD